MDPLLWDAIQSLRSCRNQQSVDSNSMYNASVTDHNQNSYHEFPGYSAGKPQSSATGSGALEGPSSTSYDFYNQESEAEDPDGEPLVIEDEDPELARKRKELREIEERIKQKKVSIALRTVEHIVKNVTEAPSANGELDACEGPTLRERVHAILQHHHPDSFPSKVHMRPKGILKSPSLSKLQGDYSLKFRVKKLMKQRHDDPFVFSNYGQVPDITPLPPARRETSAEKEASSIDLGFQRFLNILNKGVDMEMLSKIVNAEGEDLPVEDKSEPLRHKRQEEDQPLRSESQGSSSGASLPRHRCTSSGETMTSRQSQERSLSERFSLPSDEETRNDRGDRCLLSSETTQQNHSPTSNAERKINLHSQERSLGQRLSPPKDEVKNNQADRCFASSSRSRSPPALKKKKKKNEKTPKADDHREQLQNILQTLGLSLEVEEMSKLTDRTQERLYGKKRTESREEQESQQRGPHKNYRNSSSSSSSPSSSSSESGSESPSLSPSPSRCQLSRSRNSKKRLTSERSRSRDRHRDELSNHDSKQDGRKTLRQGDRDGEHVKAFTHENPDSFQPIPTYSAHNTAGFPAYADYGFPQYSQYEDYKNTHNSVTNSYWMDPRNAHPEYSHLQDPCHHLSDPSPVLINVKCHEQSAPDITFFVNPDLSQSEGQDGSASHSRCLRVVSTQQTAQPTAQWTAQQRTQLMAQWTAQWTAQQRAQQTAQWTAQQSWAKAPAGGRNMRKKKKKKKNKLPQNMVEWDTVKVMIEVKEMEAGKEEGKKKEETKKEEEEAKRKEEAKKEEEAKRKEEEAKKKEETKRKEEAKKKEEAKRKEETLRVNKEDSEIERPEEEKQAPSEEEIKRNLRKMLAAFNQKPKQNVIQPPNFISFETE